MTPVLRTFWRDAGPIAHEVDMLDPPHLDASVDLLLASGLDWHWRSAVVPHEPGPRVTWGPLQFLDPDSAPTLRADARWRDADGFGRFLALYATDGGAAKQLAPALDELEHRFVLEEGALLAIVIQVGDADHELAFVPHEVSARVAELLAALGAADLGSPRLPYRRLGTASLEAQLDL